MSAAARRIDRRALAVAALGAFYFRQGYPERARPLLAGAVRLLELGGADDPAAADDLAAALEAARRNLAYARLLTGAPNAALALLTGGGVRPTNASDALATEHLAARARRAAAAGPDARFTGDPTGWETRA